MICRVANVAGRHHQGQETMAGEEVEVARTVEIGEARVESISPVLVNNNSNSPTGVEAMATLSRHQAVEADIERIPGEEGSALAADDPLDISRRFINST